MRFIIPLIITFSFIVAMPFQSLLGKGDQGHEKAKSPPAFKHDGLQIGDAAPLTDILMMGLDKSESSLDKLKGPMGLMVIFSCNTCPYVIRWEDRYPGLFEQATKSKFGFALINSNAAKRSGDDSLDAMIDHAKKKKYGKIPYLVDKDSKLADAFGATKTPEVFLFDKNMKLAYRGAIDNNAKDRKSADKHYARDALTNLSAGEAPSTQTTRSIGCSIKRNK